LVSFVKFKIIAYIVLQTDELNTDERKIIKELQIQEQNEFLEQFELASKRNTSVMTNRYVRFKYNIIFHFLNYTKNTGMLQTVKNDSKWTE